MIRKVTTSNPSLKPNLVRLHCATAFALLVGTIGGCGGTKNNPAASEAHSNSKTEVASQSNKSNAEHQDSAKGEGSPADKAQAENEQPAEEAPVDEKKLEVQYAEAAKTEITADNAEKFAEDLEKQLDAELAE